jgi:hypothetical protein
MNSTAFGVTDGFLPRGSSTRGGSAAAADTNGIASVAKRMKERVVTLQKERDILRETEAAWEEERARLDHLQQEHAGIRRQYLEEIRNRHGVELEVLQQQENQFQCEQSIDTMIQETETILQNTVERQAAWDTTMQSLFAQHECQTELYAKNVQGQIRAHEQREANRERRLVVLRQHMDDWDGEQDWWHAQQTQMGADMERSQTNESQENYAVQALAVQVRSSLVQVRTFSNEWTNG